MHISGEKHDPLIIAPFRREVPKLVSCRFHLGPKQVGLGSIEGAVNLFDENRLLCWFVLLHNRSHLTFIGLKTRPPRSEANGPSFQADKC